MDGGRVAAAITPWLSVVGLASGGAMIYHGAISNPIFYLIMIGGQQPITVSSLQVCFSLLPNQLKHNYFFSTTNLLFHNCFIIVFLHVLGSRCV